MTLQVFSNWQEALTALGFSAPVAGVLIWAAPKIGNAVKLWWATKSGNTDLAAQLQGGVKDTVQLLRDQLADASATMKEMAAKIDSMQKTLEQLILDKNQALLDKQTAENAYFVQGLRVRRLEAQLVDAHIDPVS